MRVGVLTGTGTYALPGAGAGSADTAITVHGDVAVTRYDVGDVEALHVSRHGEGHTRLSNHVAHRANVLALKQMGAEAIVAVTVCGAVDPTVPLGSLVVFDDLHFLANRLADGSLCTLYDEPGAPERGHWIFEDPFSDGVRQALLAGSREAGVPARDGGCYGHVDGPRFNTRAEIRSLAAAGVTAVSQTAGPETVLAAEAEIPYALLGYATDYANGVKDEPTPVEELIRLIGASTEVFASVLSRALPQLPRHAPAPPGVIYRFE
ncbi:MAG TPA: MTAP family purine nucleoside phosphorylase [Thermoleophilaceae bacterium]|nr:MTAP family purine nucleoside phosphorylase [Thermoleophilaceae bacterium]